MNLEQARFNMIEQQIRPWYVLDQTVLSLLSEVPREKFVPAEHASFAFTDTRIPMSHGEVMMSPKVEARMLQSLLLQTNDKVLEIGTGSGYVTALLAKLGGHVDSLDIHEDFTHLARSRLDALGIDNVSLTTADGLQGWEQTAPYDVIAVTASVHSIPEPFKQQLKIGGRLFVIVGESPAMEARVITRASATEWNTEGLFETDLPPLTGAETPQAFVF